MRRALSVKGVSGSGRDGLKTGRYRVVQAFHIVQVFRPATYGLAIALLAWMLGISVLAQAQAPTRPAAAKPTTPSAPATTPAAPSGAVLPADFVIGPGDVLTVFFWREKDLSGDVVVRPDGKISIPLLNEMQAAGLTPEQLRLKLTESATRFLEDPTVTVVVKTINSRKVYITGQVSKPGAYPLGDSLTAIQLIAMAGGLLEYADKENIVIMRAERRPDGQPWSYRVNYTEITKRLNPKQNIDLKPGDTILVP